MKRQWEIDRMRQSILLVLALLAGCAPKAAAPPAPARSFDPYAAAELIAPGCNIHGCCRGHGDVAYMQTDKFIMCTDGRTSDICDCH